MSDELWKHLKRAGISPCEEGGIVEIDAHTDVLNTLKSYYFDCLKLDDGSLIYYVYVTLDKQGNSEIDFNKIEFSEPVGLDAEAIVASFHNRLIETLRSFLDCRSDLT